MLVCVLECLDQAEGFIDGPSNRQVVHCDLPKSSLVINDEQTSQCVAILLQVDTIVLCKEGRVLAVVSM